MVDVLLQIGAAKLVVSALLAGLAWVVQRRVAHPAIAHPLWLLVLIALLLPAVVAIPVLPGEGAAAGAVAGNVGVAGEVAERVGVGAATRNDAEPATRLPAWITEHAGTALATTWLVVATGLFVWTLARALRFRRWLVRSSRPAPSGLRREVAEIGRRLGLSRMPEVHTTTARVSPAVYWTGGRVRLVIPSFLLDKLGHQEFRAVLAHELAHVRRRDHLVRWAEWLACSAFWWNPVAWWARRELRAAEEASCDAMGVLALDCAPRTYAGSLLRVAELMSYRPMPPAPAFASGASSGRNSDSLKRRLSVLVKKTSIEPYPRRIRAVGVMAAACLLPLGLVYCGTDQTTPTPPESLTPTPAALVAVQERTNPESRATHLEELWGGDPVYAYWVFAATGFVGPYALADAPVQPVECRLEPGESDEGARDEAMATCARAMSRDFREAGVSDKRNVCVVWGSRSSGWRGICEGWEPNDRHRLRGNSSGSVLVERVAVAGIER